MTKPKSARSSTRDKTLSKKTITRLRELSQNGRDYSRPSLGDRIAAARESLGQKKPKSWTKIIYTPVGGLDKKFN